MKQDSHKLFPTGRKEILIKTAPVGTRNGLIHVPGSEDERWHCSSMQNFPLLRKLARRGLRVWLSTNTNRKLSHVPCSSKPVPACHYQLHANTRSWPAEQVPNSSFVPALLARSHTLGRHLISRGFLLIPMLSAAIFWGRVSHNKGPSILWLSIFISRLHAQRSGKRRVCKFNTRQNQTCPRGPRTSSIWMGAVQHENSELFSLLSAAAAAPSQLAGALLLCFIQSDRLRFAHHMANCWKQAEDAEFPQSNFMFPSHKCLISCLRCAFWSTAKHVGFNTCDVFSSAAFNGYKDDFFQ